MVVGGVVGEELALVPQIQECNMLFILNLTESSSVNFHMILVILNTETDLFLPVRNSEVSYVILELHLLHSILSL